MIPLTNPPSESVIRVWCTALALHNLKHSAEQSLSSFFSFSIFSFLLTSGFLLGFRTFGHPPPTQMFSCLYLIQQQLPQAFFRFPYFQSSSTDIDPFSCLYLIQQLWRTKEKTSFVFDTASSFLLAALHIVIRPSGTTPPPCLKLLVRQVLYLCLYFLKKYFNGYMNLLS